MPIASASFTKSGWNIRTRLLVAGVERVLPLAHHAEVVVVDDRELDRQLVLDAESPALAIVIWKPPSPQIAQTVSCGRANCAPIAAGTSKPIVPRPPEVTNEFGLSIQKYCAAHIWCWPTPVA